MRILDTVAAIDKVRRLGSRSLTPNEHRDKGVLTRITVVRQQTGEDTESYRIHQMPAYPYLN